MNYYVSETLIRERIEEVERRSGLAWMFDIARAEINDSSRAVSARRPSSDSQLVSCSATN
jgi:hypothetical protein